MTIEVDRILGWILGGFFFCMDVRFFFLFDVRYPEVFLVCFSGIENLFFFFFVWFGMVGYLGMFIDCVVG